MSLKAGMLFCRVWRIQKNNEFTSGTGRILLVLVCVSLLLLSGCNIKDRTPPVIQYVAEDSGLPSGGIANKDRAVSENIGTLKQKLTEAYEHSTPQQWGEYVTGVVTRFETTVKIVALTFDACGGTNGSAYDKELLEYLKVKKIPATLFINGSWIDANPEIFLALAKDPLFEIENHGANHKPLSVTGQKAYGITGTDSIAAVVEEVETNARKIENLTGRKPRYFRSGTAYYDEIAVNIVEDLGYRAVNFNIIGDGGATFNAEQIKKSCSRAKPGDIIIFHMNHPESRTAQGVKAVVEMLAAQGFEFVRLEDYL
jgi:peptidoglycan/xylan/chitin deacetylase (PgdA/CDA1 family)